MNQDQIKALLLNLENTAIDFTVVFTGKQSVRVNGLYKPDTHEIILHNKNFSTDTQLIYTAIHEYAHHLHSEIKHPMRGCRSHTNDFWVIFHKLLEKAETLGIYKNIFSTEQEFVDITKRIKLLFEDNGTAMLDLGKLMIQAEALCKKHFVRFEDYIDRAICMPRISVHSAMRSQAYNIPSSLGWDAMKLVSSIKKPDLRQQAIEAFNSGQSHNLVKSLVKTNKPSSDPKETLILERSRIEKTIHNLEARLDYINSELEKF